MNKINYLILIFVFVTSIASADVYVITNTQNGVYSVSNENDAVVPSGDKVTVMKGKNIQNLPITGNPQLYNFNNGAFTINTAAVQAKQSADQAAIAQQTAYANAKASAIAKLTDAISKVNVNDVLTNQELSTLIPS